MIPEACTTLSTLHKTTKQMRKPSGDNRNLDDQSKHKDNSSLQTSGIQTSISDSEMKRRQQYMGNWIHLGKYHETMFV
jgi:hypothetical protein